MLRWLRRLGIFRENQDADLVAAFASVGFSLSKLPSDPKLISELTDIIVANALNGGPPTLEGAAKTAFLQCSYIVLIGLRRPSLRLVDKNGGTRKKMCYPRRT